MPEKALATPAKEFFINMLTRDISIADCILDLLDNAVDGARRSVPDNPNHLGGFFVHLHLSSEEFRIQDNCGGITLEDAREYAFNFGRRRGAPLAPTESIGIYGIGMKRALFKLGKAIEIVSSTEQNSFEATIDVKAWEADSEWTFDLIPGDPLVRVGTKITVRDLSPGIGEELIDPAFHKVLSRAISRGYALFIKAGLEITLNQQPIDGHYIQLLVGDDFVPARTSYKEEDVQVEIIAGMAARPPRDDSAEARIPHQHNYGWYVVCNDRVVLAADKSNRTVWGNDGFNAWHNQYNGFLGIASFRSTSDPGALPWTTTKRDLDLSHPAYRRALTRMKAVTKPYIEYTNARKDQEERVAELELSTRPVSIEQVGMSQVLKVPKLEPRKVEMGNVLYRKRKARLKEAATALGNKNMSYKEVGSRTFEYYFTREVDEV